MKFLQLKKSLKEAKPSPAYLFEGEEQYFKEKGESLLKDKFLSEPSLNFSTFEGENLKGASLQELISALDSFPFLSEKRIVKVTDFYPSEKEYETYLKKYFASPQETTILLIINSQAPKGKYFDLKKAPNVVTVDCSRADEETVLRWIYTKFKRSGIEADTETCERVMQYCLGDMARIVGETDKLVAYAQGGKKLSVEDVDAVVYKDSNYKAYEMTNALGMKNYNKYLSVMNELLAKGLDEMSILNIVCSYYRTMFEISLLKKTDAETAKILNMKEFAVKANRRQADMIGLKKVKESYSAIVKGINAVKSGELTPQSALLKINAALFFTLEANNIA